MEKIIGIFTLTEIKAIAECAGDTEIQDALLVHEKKDKYHEGDCVLYGYSLNSFETESEITDALRNECPEIPLEIDEEGVYHA